MTVIALILLALVIFTVIAAVMGDADDISVDVFDTNIDTTVLEVFLAGVLTGLVALASLVLLRIGLRRSRQRRAEVRELRRRAQLPPASPDDADASSQHRGRAEPETALTDATEPPTEHPRE